MTTRHEASESEKVSKPTILVVVGHYLPGFKAGGILRSIANMVVHLGDEYQFLILTRDRDLGDGQPYGDVHPGEWKVADNCKVRYLAPNELSSRSMRQVISETPHDLIYLNSFFEPLTVKALWNRMLGRIEPVPIIVAARGEFGWASLRLKFGKKALFIILSRIIGLYRGVIWHASSKFEVDHIARALKVRREKIQIAMDLPSIPAPERSDQAAPTAGRENRLKIVFLSRISREKNLHFALDVLSRVSFAVQFDIIGPPEDRNYWNECRKMVDSMPENVRVEALGELAPSEVIETLGRYDLLFFPSGGENYGHVIAEALCAGTPVLTSTATPWRDLAHRGLGWDLKLDNPTAFVRILEALAHETTLCRATRRLAIKAEMAKITGDPRLPDEHRRLFNQALKSTSKFKETSANG